MLKKIVKYGNSCALVLDKALLELLNMEEGSIVKIKTDGVSLIITPQNALVQETVSPTITVEDTMSDAVRNALTKSFGDEEKARQYQADLKEITERYGAIAKDKMAKPEVRQAVAAIQKCFANDEANPEYTKQIKATHHRYVPELESMNQELYRNNLENREFDKKAPQNFCPERATIAERQGASEGENFEEKPTRSKTDSSSYFGINALAKKYALMSSLDASGGKMDQMTAEFAKVHEKYQYLQHAIA